MALGASESTPDVREGKDDVTTTTTHNDSSVQDRQGVQLSIDGGHTMLNMLDIDITDQNDSISKAGHIVSDA